MRILASWWKRGPVRQLGTIVVVFAIVGLLGSHIDVTQRGSVISRVSHVLLGPHGEVWT